MAQFASQLATKEDRTNNKARLLDDFQTILAERRSLSSRVATREEEAEKERNRGVLETVSQFTADSIVRGLADLQLDFGGIITGLSTRLTTETDKLDDLRRAIAVERDRLQALQQTRVVADVLYLINQEHQETLRQLDQQFAQDQEQLDKEQAETRQRWQQEQSEFAATTTETRELLQRDRQRQEEDYIYETARSQTIATDDYDEKRRQLERQIQETMQAKEKDWAERDRILAANQTALQEYQQKAATFPTELEEAIKKSREDGIREANQDAKVKADLFAKEWESIQQGYDLQIQSLEAKIQKQTDQISEISTQLQTALRQAQELAMRAFDSSSSRSTPRGE